MLDITLYVGTVFMELWKRRQARLAWEWDLIEEHAVYDEEVRPEYETKASDYRINPVTREREAYISPRKVAIRYTLSIMGISLLVSTWIDLFACRQSEHRWICCMVIILLCNNLNLSFFFRY